MEVCICGNVIDSAVKSKIRHVFCRCTEPGPGKRAGKVEGFLDDDLVNEAHYDERKRTGLPMLSPLEKSINDKWA